MQSVSNEVLDKIESQVSHILRTHEHNELKAKIIELAQNWYMHGSADCFVRMMNKTKENNES